MKKLALVAAMVIALHLPAQAFAQADEPPSSPMEKAITQLPHDKGESFRDAMQSAHEENKDLYEQEQQLRGQIHDILSAGTYEKSAFKSKSKKLRQVHEKIRKNLDDAFADAVSGLSTDEREAMANALEQQHEMHKAAKKGE